MKQTTYFFAENATINEGFTTGTITSAAMYFTKDYIYTIPFSGIGSTGTTTTRTDYSNPEEFLNYIAQNIETLSSVELHERMTDFLPEKRIVGILSLDKFKINTGWLTAGIKLKKRGDNLKVISIRPRTQLQELKAFYNL